MEPVSYNDNALEAYLLDELADDELAALEDQLLRDEELFLRLEAVEMNLIDRYLENEMTDTEKQRFEAGFLSSPDNDRKLNEARIFRESLAVLRKKAPPENVVAFPFALRRVFQSGRGPERIAAAGFMSTRNNEQELSGPRVFRESLFQSVRVQQITAAAVALIVIAVIVGLIIVRSRESHLPDRNISSMSTRVGEQSSPSPSKPITTGRIQQQWLYKKQRSGEELRVIISPDTEVLRLWYELDTSVPKYALPISIKDERGSSIFPAPGTIAAKPILIRDRAIARAAISVDVPVRNLKFGERYRFEVLESSRTFRIQY